MISQRKSGRRIRAKVSILWCLVCECEPSDGGYIVGSRSNRLLQIRTTERPVPKDKGRDVN